MPTFEHLKPGDEVWLHRKNNRGRPAILVPVLAVRRTQMDVGLRSDVDRDNPPHHHKVTVYRATGHDTDPNFTWYWIETEESRAEGLRREAAEKALNAAGLEIRRPCTLPAEVLEEIVAVVEKFTADAATTAREG